MSYAITIGSSGQSFTCAEGHNVLQGMMRRGRNSIPVGCRGGGCGVCKVRVLEGRYRTETMSATCVTADERASGLALACKLIPETDLRVEVVGSISRVLSRDASTLYFYTGAPDAGKPFKED